MAISRTCLYVLVTVELMENIFFQRYHEIKFTTAVLMVYNTTTLLFLEFDGSNIGVLDALGAR